MRNKQVYSLKQRLDHLFTFAKNMPDDETKAHFARYLCVLSCGFLEQALLLTLNEYIQGHSSREVASFAQLNSAGRNPLNNPGVSNILAAVQRFGGDWSTSLEQRMDRRVKDHIGSVVENRHQIAHQVNTIPLSLGMMSEYYQSILEFVEIFEDHCKRH